MKAKILFFSTVILAAVMMSGCGIQSIPQSKNAVDAALAEVTNQYKRRADLIPNLVNTVRGYASHERETLEGVVNARAKATQTQVNLGDVRPEQVQEYMQAQGALTQALSRLMVVVERYPDLKANENFRDLQAQLEGTENRTTIARRRYIEAIQNYNNLITVPPSSWTNAAFYKHEKMPQWDVSAAEREQIEQAPEVQF
jgi:LemA protein